MPHPSDSILLDAAHMLALFEQALDPDWVVPKKLTGAHGYEILQAYAAVGARVSAAIEQAERGVLMLWADDAAYATGAVQFSRPTSAAGAVTVKAGTVVSTSSGGRRFLVLADVPFVTNTLGPFDAPVVALQAGAGWNVPGAYTTAGGEAAPGAIDTIARMVQTGPAGTFDFVDGTIVVTQAAATSGGLDPWLDGLGSDRGLPRLPGEPAPTYRYRIRHLPDVLTPAAVVRHAQQLLGPYGQAGVLEETFDARVVFAADVSPADVSLANGASPPTDAFPLVGVCVDGLTNFGAFVVVVDRLQPVTERGLICDDPSPSTRTLTTQGMRSPYGLRAVAACDIDSQDAAVLSGAILQPACDGYDSGAQAVYAALDQQLQQIRAAGVTAVTLVRG